MVGSTCPGVMVGGGQLERRLWKRQLFIWRGSRVSGEGLVPSPVDIYPLPIEHFFSTKQWELGNQRFKSTGLTLGRFQHPSGALFLFYSVKMLGSSWDFSMRLKPGKFFVRWRWNLEPGGAGWALCGGFLVVLPVAFLLRLIAENPR